MHENELPASTPTGKRFKISMLLLDDFNSMAMHAFLDPFRTANYLKSANLYEWQFISPRGGITKASNGLAIATTQHASGSMSDSELVVVNGSWGIERFYKPHVMLWLRQAAQRGATLCGIDTGAFLLAHAGLLANRKATVHYEHMAAFRELYPDVELTEERFVMDGDRLSCCGGLAATDLALEIIRLQHGIEVANASSRYIFHERLRAGNEGQLPAKSEPVGFSVPRKLREAIILMERNLENVLSIGEIASRIGLSQRQLCRLFAQHTNSSPVRYYLDVRLDRARGLLTQTELPILEVAIASGFTNASQFSRAYRSRFGLAPSRDRVEGRIPFQFRSFPSHAGVSRKTAS